MTRIFAGIGLMLLAAGTAHAQPAEPVKPPEPARTNEVGGEPSESRVEPAATATGPALGEPPAAAAPSAVPSPPAGPEPSATAPAAVVTKPGAASPLKIETPTSSIKLGVLLQPQYEAIGSPTLDGWSQNLFVRRTRVLVGVTLFSDFELFFETDYPDLFKAAPDGAKNTPGLNVQDVFATYKPLEELKFDVGYMLPPLSHNALQSAASLYSWDYFANTFRHGNVFHSSANPVGRDVGAQLRGLLAGGLVEYRVGLFQGQRGKADSGEVGATNKLRAAGRIQLNFLDPEPGFFYSGTYLGTKRIFSVGGSYDFQNDYKHWSADAFLDLPLGDGVLTAQSNVVGWDGEGWVDLPQQTALMGELGYLVNVLHVSPIARAERRWVKHETAAAPDETRVGGGLAFWPHGHNINVKAFYTRIDPDPAKHGYNQISVQGQFFVF